MIIRFLIGALMLAAAWALSACGGGGSTETGSDTPAAEDTSGTDARTSGTATVSTVTTAVF